MKHTVDRLSLVFLTLALGAIGLYVFGLVLGVFAPADLWFFGIAVAILAALIAVHSVRLRRRLRHPGPEHDELMRDMHQLRERRGF